MPRVSIGLPVYNGEKFLEEAIVSILDQTFEDFELIIADNASTDGTQDICERFAAKDSRICYYRGINNQGASWNYNRTFDLSSGEYFKWIAHDDRCAPTFLTECIAVLDRGPSVVLSFPQVKEIDESGRKLKDKITLINKKYSDQSHERFRNLIRMDYSCDEIFGVFRSGVLKKTKLIGSYADSDRVLLSEVGLYGQFHEVQEVLFAHRISATVKLYPGRHERTAWFDPSAKGHIIFPYWRELVEYLAVIRRTQLPREEKVGCYLAMFGWLKDNKKSLLNDLVRGLKDILVKYAPWTRTIKHKLSKGHLSKR